MGKMIRTVAVASMAAGLCVALGSGTSSADSGSADMMLGFAPPQPVVTLLPGGVVHVESAPGTPPGANWWCGAASINPPVYIMAPAGAPLPQDLQMVPNTTVDVDCSYGQTHARMEVQTLP